ncbi:MULTISPECIES: FAD-dependent oxidoreductase [Rhodococcus]|uniref:Oxidoreductase n=1 Tax=Rhodococcus opacus RKJ300 = JCM 13270 TaxID=1165867 RepID=I0WIN3_RHOOP|nr:MULTISPECIES: FAD-dependent oxidoreductase [Rhodococcus]EID76249.1 oxidoreductase [Rhodococcus opacus RKJ300 = JCM 13270]QQZ17971.1 FAD-dependent oxidoreductase [Rhodococcus sp. 21391]
MSSLWLDHVAGHRGAVTGRSWDERGRYDTVVVGAGVTGLITGLLLARAGQHVAVVEARTIGAVTTGNTTGKVSVLQGTRLAEIGRRHASHILRSYVEGNLEGQQWLLRYCHDREIPVGTAPDFTFAQTESGVDAVRAQYTAARSAGLPVRLVPELEIPVPHVDAVTLDDQAFLDPMPVLHAVARDLITHGGDVFEHRRVTSVRTLVRFHVLSTPDGDIEARRVVLATGTPILDRGGFFARLKAERSYAAAFRVPGGAPGGMYLTADQPTRSLRPAEAGRVLVVGGNGHDVGRSTSPQAAVDDLLAWTGRHFPGATPTHRWSAQDYSSLNALPYVGPLVPGSDGILIATGYGKWGLSNGVAAGLVLAGRILGGHMRWGEAFQSYSPTQLFDLPAAVKANGEVAVEMVAGWGDALVGRQRGQGRARIVREGLLPVGEYTSDGHTERVCAVCPHLGGVLRWNDAEASWDCPLHGSRFTAGGTLLEGPATTDLRRL